MKHCADFLSTIIDSADELEQIIGSEDVIERGKDLCYQEEQITQIITEQFALIEDLRRGCASVGQLAD